MLPLHRCYRARGEGETFLVCNGSTNYSGDVSDEAKKEIKAIVVRAGEVGSCDSGKHWDGVRAGRTEARRTGPTAALERPVRSAWFAATQSDLADGYRFAVGAPLRDNTFLLTRPCD